MASWIERSVRSLAGSGPLPTLTGATTGPAGLAVAFDEEPSATAPTGWTVHGPKLWTVNSSAELSGDALSPFPGLVSIGRRDHSIVLIDPESVAGVIALDGPDEVARGVALSMAIDTATHPWADSRAVTMVGFADDVSAIGQGNIHRTSDLGRVLEGLENVARYQRTACQKAGAESAREARRLAPGAIDWGYQLVLCSGVPNADELTRLTALAADPQVALGVVVIGAVPDAAMRLSAQVDGRLIAPLHGIDVDAQVLTARSARDLAALYDFPDSVRSVSLDQIIDTLESNIDASHDERAVVRIGILGPVEIEAPGEIDPERREFLTELATFLSLQPVGRARQPDQRGAVAARDPGRPARRCVPAAVRLARRHRGRHPGAGPGGRRVGLHARHGQPRLGRVPRRPSTGPPTTARTVSGTSARPSTWSVARPSRTSPRGATPGSGRPPRRSTSRWRSG